jgi:hypothetical protein
MAITNIPRSYQVWAAIGATPNDFNLDAGAYGLTLHATAWGTAQLFKLVDTPPGAVPANIYVAVGAAIAADGYQELHIPAGQYRLVLTGVTALSGDLALIAPGSR